MSHFWEYFQYQRAIWQNGFVLGILAGAFTAILLLALFKIMDHSSLRSEP